ncbi:MAG: hypothetical protein ABEJ34_00945 [Haloferacaceae archaeon]
MVADITHEDHGARRRTTVAVDGERFVPVEIDGDVYFDDGAPVTGDRTECVTPRESRHLSVRPSCPCPVRVPSPAHEPP